MKAIRHTIYGAPDVLRLEQLERPTPTAHEVLVNVYAASANTLDLARIRGIPFLARLIFEGLRKRSIPQVGIDIAGIVAAVGTDVAQFQPGDAVFGLIAGGGFAEYVIAPEHAFVRKPANISFAAAAATPVAGITALQGLRNKGQIQPENKVLIQGASGGVGTFAVQIAKSFGAEVSAICSTPNIDIARSIGADLVIDYTKEDPLKHGHQYDLILAVNGYRPIKEYRQLLNPTGRYVMVGATGAHAMQAVLQAMLLGPMISRKSGQQFGFMGIARANQQDLGSLRDLLEAGKITPVIDTCYPLERAADALRYLAEGHARGKVIVTIADPAAM